ncbi:major facilitator superfamily domain-containing protein [Aspergillus alliaceus]|uniref:Major facilitator superfamily domain-containing protein n=1 Tax=Petromyces alliaceus TaxID=209559 RepID=A0A5N7CJK0_PETAA|nr:major facilitator superfamily domain-containing protein [Aspergillus alliaceus]
MVALALSSIAADFHITDQVLSQLTLSVFVLAYALANLFYLVFNIGCAVSQNKVQMIVCRFFAGLGGSATLAAGGGSIYSLVPLLRPALGPIAGGFIAEKKTWQWVFYSTSVADGVIQLMDLFFLRETYGSRLLKLRAKRLRKETGDDSYQTEAELQNKTLSQVLRSALIRPFRLLLTQPICLACYMAYIYGIMYLVLSTFPTLWTSPAYYNGSIGIGGLNYISLGLGFWCGSQNCAPPPPPPPLLRPHLPRPETRNNNIGRPEFRLPLLGIAAILLPVGLFIYGWTAQAHYHWIAPNIGSFLFATGTIVSFQCMQTYMVDMYT